MTTDKILDMIKRAIAHGMVPRTIILTPDDAKAMNIPSWTREMFGLKVVIAHNYPESVVVPHFYETTKMAKTDEKKLAEYHEYVARKQVELFKQ